MTQTINHSATGVVTENLPNTMFRVKILQSDLSELVDTILLCTLAGKMRMRWVRLLPGDKVQMDVSPLDKSKGRIKFKIKN